MTLPYERATAGERALADTAACIAEAVAAHLRAG